MWSLLAWLLRAVVRPALVTVVAASPQGHLCSLDPDSGALLADVAAPVTDVVADASGAVWTVEPGEKVAGRLARYRVSPSALTLERVLPFDALDGRILSPADDPIVLGLAEGATLAIAHEGGGAGFVWPMPASALALSGHGGVAITTLDDAISPWRLHRAFVASGSITPMLTTPLATPPASCGGRAVATPDGIAIVAVVDAAVALFLGERAIARVAVPPGSCVEDAVSLPDGRVAALIGPAPALVLLSVPGGVALALPPLVLPHAPWVSHRIAYDEGRHRLWLATDGALTAVDLLPAPAIAPAKSGCAAAAVTIARGP